MASPKYRDYFVTINKGAESYEEALEITKELNYSLYALIIHDKDKIVTSDGAVTPKLVHKHIVVELKNPISFKSMQSKFPGAHIENIKYKKAAYQYLIHNRPNASEKYQYAVTDIVSNNLAAVKEAITAEEGFRLFKENEFLRYIAEGIVSPYQFAKVFGLNVYKQYFKSYQDMIAWSQKDPEMQEDLKAIRIAMEEELPF